MKTSSAKAKGRLLQQEVRDALIYIAGGLGKLRPGDIESRGMGQSGVDIILSPEAQDLYPFDIECKNVEKLNVVTTFVAHFKKYAARNTLKLLIHRKNRTEAMVTMRLKDFLEIYESVLKRVEWTQSIQERATAASQP